MLSSYFDVGKWRPRINSDIYTSILVYYQGDEVKEVKMSVYM
jgi:hypothetical protein